MAELGIWNINNQKKYNAGNEQLGSYALNNGNGSKMSFCI